MTTATLPSAKQQDGSLESLTQIRDELDKIQAAVADAIQKQTDGIEPTPTVPTRDLRMGRPTDEQLAKMNQYRPVGADEYTADEVVTVPVVASHNLIQLSGLISWHPRALAAMANVLVDRPHIINHDWDDAGTSVGFFYDSEILKTDNAPAKDLSMNGQYETNQMVVGKYGYQRLILHACIQASTPAVDGYRFRRLGDVSTGNLVYPDYICPLDDLSFADENCPYLPPTDWTLWMAEQDKLSEEEKALIAPYMMRDGVFYGVETSAVVVGNLPGAGVVRAG